MVSADTLPLLLLVLAAVLGGVVVFRSARARRRSGALRARRQRWSGPMGDIDASGAAEEASDFQPTRVVSYADAVRDGWFEAPAGTTVDGRLAVAPVAPVGAVDTVPRHLRVKLRERDGGARFVTMTVLRLVVEDGERTLHARLGDGERIQRIPVSRIEAAIDLQGRAKIEDPWSWLRTRLGVVSRLERGTTGSWPASMVRRDPGSIDTATQAA